MPNLDHFKNSYIDTAQTVTQSTPFTLLLNGLQNGAARNQRIGQRATFGTLDMNIRLMTGTNSFSNAQSTRVMIVREKPCLGTALSLESLLDAAAPYTHYVYNYKDRDFTTRFFVIYDEVFSLDGVSPFAQTLRIKKSLNFTSNYARGDTGTVTDIDTNSLYLVVITDWTSASTPPSFVYDYNLFFQS